MNNTIKQQFEENIKLLEKDGRLVPGKLLCLKDDKFFHYVNAIENNVTLFLDPLNSDHIGDAQLGQKLGRKSISQIDSPNKFVQVKKNEPLLFLGYKPLNSNIIVLTNLDYNGDRTHTYLIDSKNYNSFFEDGNVWSENEFVKTVVKEMIEINFEYKVMQFLYEKKVIWWAFEQLNDGMKFLEKSFSFLETNENGSGK